jgi:hypothetical protein
MFTVLPLTGAAGFSAHSPTDEQEAQQMNTTTITALRHTDARRVGWTRVSHESGWAGVLLLTP